MRRFFLLILLPLAACATPRQQCETAATEDLRVVSALIVEAEQNIARGYALETELVETPRLVFCYGGTTHNRRVGASFCNRTVLDRREKPVAIDLKAEQAKLNDLRAKQALLKRQAAEALARCQAQYPDA